MESRRRFRLRGWAILVLILFGLFVVWAERLGGWSYLIDHLVGKRLVVFGTMASLAGSLLGFVLAAFAFVIGSLDARRMEPVRRSAADLVSMFAVATLCLGMSTILNLLALLLDSDAAPVRWLTYAIVLFTLLSVAALGRCLRTIYQIGIILSNKPKDRWGDQ
jgi:hypothetical protein